MSTKNVEPPHEFLRLIGENIRKERIRKNFTYEQLAIEIGLNAGHIYRIEKGHNITLLTLLKICLALKTTPEKLVKVSYHYNTEQLEGLTKSKKTSKVKKKK